MSLPEGDDSDAQRVRSVTIDKATAPALDEIEVSVFGPGYGECILIHVGSGKWVVIDSCLDDDGNPAALSYLNSIGAEVGSSIQSLLATHWHDDHIKGLSTVYEQASSAQLAVSAALREAEFFAFLEVYDNQPAKKLDRGGTEMLKCLKLAHKTARSPKIIQEDTIVQDWDAGDLAHGESIQIRALSPSSRQYTDFLTRISSTYGALHGKTKTRISDPNKNDLSIVTILHVGDDALILGADLEERGHSELGWSAIVNLRKDRSPLSFAYKIPHHGSAGAHNQDVWNELLRETPISVTTPWRLAGNSLPKPSDLARIRKLSGQAYITSASPITAKRRYSREALKQIKYSGVELEASTFKCGQVRIRWRPGSGVPPVVGLSNGAKLL
ncbi:MAG: MBL fold metallo-hydrolase [Planctomycetaceae bacterium]|nr:MBL fold metallo-hydrolase [Planctomycetaceae bacterium]